MEISSGKRKSTPNSKQIITLLIFSVFLILIPSLYNRTLSMFQSPGMLQAFTGLSNKNLKQKCDIFKGNWVLRPNSTGPYYTNASKCVIDDRQNCMKFGRPDVEFMKWRWKPEKCELPLFDAALFMELVRGKSIAFIGDSLARNQMQSLVCLLSTISNPVDASHVEDRRFRRWFYPDYNFTLAALWSTHLVKSEDADPNGYSLNSLMNLYLDEPDQAWLAQIQPFNYLIISAGQWFFRPFMYYQKGKLMGCYKCNKHKIKHLTNYYGYKMAHRTAFKTLLKLKNFKGVTFLRTFSPQHFENGEWDKGGNCVRTMPYTQKDIRLDGFVLELNVVQNEELKIAEREGRERGLKFILLDTTELMLLRPDGHPNHYGHWPNENISIADCVHWCLPGPIDTWNEILLHMLKTQANMTTSG